MTLHHEAVAIAGLGIGYHPHYDEDTPTLVLQEEIDDDNTKFEGIL